eukprot:2020664-Rhodomonas_salina.1
MLLRPASTTRTGTSSPARYHPTRLLVLLFVLGPALRTAPGTDARVCFLPGLRSGAGPLLDGCYLRPPPQRRIPQGRSRTPLSPTAVPTSVPQHAFSLYHPTRSSIAIPRGAAHTVSE